ncbi:hypothetical protein K2173_004279 [Erythroxylum novogranatense]|uniref:Regulator of telomere elongation helicase 1 homolog n=1 Tax=Erythroxylum novogranatense TaxID=1862640 RepID=A0AAV8U5I5_9ROSI|nr:hypothetical protein K2173_004279 [Erythroxylum novogranatense]
MPTYQISGVDVDFPFEAYDSQLVYMEKVIYSLKNRCNALLESPTGTGKTLSLLCATLAWRKSLGGFSTGKIGMNSQNSGMDADNESTHPNAARLPTIIYTSRTHSQIRQVVQELKRSNYRPKMVVLGSREQLCIHEDVSLLHGKVQTNACHYLRRRRENQEKQEKHRCNHYSCVPDFVKKNPHLGDEPIDIEDLVTVGKKFGPCPYYVARELHKVADILFAPYNYVIDRAYRKSLTIDWNSSILIFDEAHNLEGLCADAASFDLPSGLLTACINEAKSCIDLSVGRREKSNDKSGNPDNFAILRALLLKLEKRIAEVPIESRELGFTRPGPYIYELLADLNITSETASKLIDIIDEAVILIEEDKQHKPQGTACRLESIGDMLRIIFRDKSNSHARYYRVHVQEIEANSVNSLKGKVSRMLSWWCFNPGIAMEEFSKLGVGSIILTSGTLSPLDSFAHELNLDFPVQLENPHVISSNQLWAGVVPVGPSGNNLNSSYRTRDSLEYKQELGNAIVNFARIVPDGLLVFFPSYYLLEQCIGCWKSPSHTNSTTIWERICNHKKPVIEPRQSALFLSSIEDYMDKLKGTKSSGAVFFAVCRGKVSEGLDFADHAGRAVVITGIPFALRNDPKVRLKREFLDQQSNTQNDGCKILKGEDWYSQQASRAVNQAVGRVIRHRHDYGAIIFCDERFTHPNRQSQISLWIQPYLKCYSKFGDVIFTLSRFFRDEGTRGFTDHELIHSQGIENIKEVKTLQPVDRLYLDSFLTPKTPTDQAGCMKSVSSLLSLRKVKDLGQLEEVLPANRSYLTPLKGNQDVRSNTLSTEQFLTSCSAKKLKVSNTESCTKGYTTSVHRSSNESSQHVSCRSTNNSVKIQSSCISDNESRQNAQFGQALLQKDYEITEKEEADLCQNRGQSTSVPLSDQETRGAAFLSEVKEKLSAAEYKDFVGFMKALKSKAMKINHVLQSIVRLFSGTDRLPLLNRFKDYLPLQYRSSYEEYVEANDELSNNCSKSKFFDKLNFIEASTW